MTTWLTAHQAAAHCNQARAALSAGAAHVTVSTVRSWIARGHLTPTGLDAAGHQLFSVADVAHAELATRDGALRRAGISTTR